MKSLGLLPLLSALALAATPLAGSASPPNTAKVSVQTDIQPALDALQQLLSAYSTGNQAQVESLVEPTMIGYSRVVDQARDAMVAYKQVRVTLADTQTQISEDVVIVQTNWEKRFVTTPGKQSGRRSGHCTFVMRSDESVWRLSALSGDNPFGSE